MNGKIDFEILLLTAGRNIKIYRSFLKEDISVTANELGISVSNLEEIEQGAFKGITLELITRIANYLNINLQLLFDLQIVQVFNNSQNILPGERTVTLKNEQAAGYKLYIADLKENNIGLQHKVIQLETELKSLVDKL